jgi:2-polyprenyl-3-methyl-5-hydroxy-6-metoxy-1,4-benzoquinol methylase
MKAKRPCPVCNAGEVDVLHTQRFELPQGHPLAAGYEVVVCSACGFIYADTAVTQADYDRFYAEHSKYEDAKTGTGGVDNPFDWKRQQETARQIADVLKDVSASILDVGCANGGMLKALKELGYENLCGIDPSPVCVENTRRLGVEAHQGSLFLPFKENAYDCVILSHTLEHVQDVCGAVDWIGKRLKPGGMVYIETPDAVRYVDFIYAPLQDFNTEHINHFSLTSLRNLMEAQGFIFMEGASKDLVVGRDMFYPAVFGFWKQAEDSAGIALSKDALLLQKIKEYIARSKTMMSDIDARISTLISRAPSIIVWGAGQLSMKLLAETSLARADILAFVDNNPINHGQVLHGKPIVSPSELAKWDAPILIATLLHHRSIAKQIREMGLKNEIVFLLGETE